MKTESRKITVYVADDGREFMSETECKLHEREVANTHYYRVDYSPDLTEGRGLQRYLLLAVKAEWSSEAWAELWCEKTLGSRFAFVQGVQITPKWSVCGIPATDAQRMMSTAKIQKLEVVEITGGEHESWKPRR
jgi:hypothetical protein